MTRKLFKTFMKKIFKINKSIAFFTTFQSVLFYHIAIKRAPSNTEPNDID